MRGRRMKAAINGGGGGKIENKLVLLQLASRLDELAEQADRPLKFQLVAWSSAIRRQDQAAEKASAEALRLAAG